MSLPVPAGVESGALLGLWERGLGYPRIARGEALLEAAGQGADASRTFGQRNACLLDLHATFFGSRIDLISRCPTCGAAAQFSADCGALTVCTPPPAQEEHRLEVEGHVIDFRLPTSADIAVASSANGDDEFVFRLLERCVLRCTREGAFTEIGEVPNVVLDALSQHMEALDPTAPVTFGVVCPECDTRWEAPLDLEELIWTKLRAAAERLLLDIDTLARAYGWTERDVLSLSEARRAAYLQLAAG